MLRSPNIVRPTSKKTTTVVLTGGGSGGHITPLPPIGHELKKYNPNCVVVYIGLKGDRIDAKKKDYQVFDKVYYVTSGKFRRYHAQSFISRLVDVKTLLLNFIDIFKVITGTISAVRLLGKIKPDIVLSKGGFVVVPVGVAAWLHRIPIITHDSDVVAGMANRIVGRWAVVHATGMPPENYNYPQETISYVGIPLAIDQGQLGRDEQKSYRLKRGIPAENLILLVAGGGLGSRTINELVIQIAPELLKLFPKLQVIHITGERLLDSVKSAYAKSLDKGSLERVKILGFSDEFSNLITIADLVIARAGATTLAELELYAKASIIIPASFLAGGHQLKNAQFLDDADAAAVVSEEIPPQDLLNLVQDLLSNESKRMKLSQAISSLAHPNAAKELAEIIINQALKR